MRDTYSAGVFPGATCARTDAQREQGCDKGLTEEYGHNHEDCPSCHELGPTMREAFILCHTNKCGCYCHHE